MQEKKTYLEMTATVSEWDAFLKIFREARPLQDLLEKDVISHLNGEREQNMVSARTVTENNNNNNFTVCEYVV